MAAKKKKAKKKKAAPKKKVKGKGKAKTKPKGKPAKKKAKKGGASKPKKKAAKKKGGKKKAAKSAEPKAAAPKIPLKKREKFYGFKPDEWRDLKQVVLMAAFQGRLSKQADKYKDRQIVQLVKKFVLTRSRVHIDKAVVLLCPDEDHPWSALFKIR